MSKIQEKNKTITNVIEIEFDMLKRHIQILKTVQKNEPLGMIKISRLTQYPQHLVRNSLATLEKDGIIEATRKGAIITDVAYERIILVKKRLKNMDMTINEIIDLLE